MDLSGIIFVVLAVAWAVYLVPKAVRHHEEMAHVRSVERFSTAMRVLARREPVNRRDARLVVTPPRPQGRMLVPASRPSAPPAAEEVRRPAARPAPEARRAAARAAARRRRHILSALLVATAAVGATGALGVVPWWAVAAPVALVVGYLVLCRVTVRRERQAVAAAEPVAREIRRAARVEAAYRYHVAEEDTIAMPVDEDTLPMSTEAIEAALAAPTAAEADIAAAAVARPAAGGSLWDPVPMTLPTYVTKERAARTVRTIDLQAADAWTSGRSEADSALVKGTEDASSDAAGATPGQRAVGS